MIKNAIKTIKIIETAFGIFSLVKRSNTGDSIKVRKIARKKGKSTGFASRITTPPIKITTITREAVVILFPDITFYHYNLFKSEIKIYYFLIQNL